MKGSLIVVDLFPSLLQPEGDAGNAVVLVHRARTYGLDASLQVVHPGDQLPDADIICLGGSEDADLGVAAERVRAAASLPSRIADGAVVFGVGAGYALLGHEAVAPDGRRHQGAGVLDLTMGDSGQLVAGPMVTHPDSTMALGEVSGYEYHRQVATLGPAAEPWLRLEVGRGDGGWAGARQGSVVGSWLHGPALPRNPDLADALLRWAGVAVDPKGCPDDPIAATVRARRVTEARTSSM